MHFGLKLISQNDNKILKSNKFFKLIFMKQKLLQLKKFSKLLVSIFLITMPVFGWGQIISQYVETNSGTVPKGIEIWNNTGSTLDFSVSPLIIQQGTNGGALADIPSTAINIGNLAPGAVLVIGTSDIGTYLTNQGLASVFFKAYTFTFNGDDALAVKIGETVTDIFGTPGSDPGTAWTGGGVSTANQNIALKDGIVTGSIAWTDPSLRFSIISTTPATVPAGLSGFGIAPVVVSSPMISVSPTTLTGFTYVQGAGPSTAQSFTISGSNLTQSISIVPPTNYEISISTGNDFIATNPLILNQVGGTVNNTAVYVRLKAGLPKGLYQNEAIDATSLNATNTTVLCSGSVVLPATKLAFDNVPASGLTGNSIAAFTVHALDNDNSVSTIFTGTITLSLASGPGNISGTLTQAAVNGIASFNNISFDQPGTYTLQASSAGLTPAISNSITILLGPALTEIILPQFIQGINGTNSNRIPYAFRVKLDNLIPNATYRYINQVVIASDSPTTYGAGNVIYVNGDGTITLQTGNPNFVTPGRYGEFLTNSQGSYTGWFMTEPTGNERFTPGQNLFMRIRLNNGNNGEDAVTYLTTNNSIKVINFGTTADANQGTAIRAESMANPKNFVFLYDNTLGTGRPLYGSSIETTGVDFSATTWALFYRDNVAGDDGSWGGIIPNMNANGVKLVQENSHSNGEVVSRRTSPNGVWGANSTVNPTGGTNNVIVIDFIQSTSLDVTPNTLSGFAYVEGNGPSGIQSFVVSGSNITSGVSVIPPSNYEISLVGGTGFEPVNSIFLGPNASSAINASVFVRLKSGLAVGNYSDETIFISTESAPTQTVLLSGAVLAGIPEPVNHASLFEAEAVLFNKILVSWTDALPPADGYLIKGSTVGFDNIAAPVDGIEENSTGLVGKVASGIGSFSFDNLNASTVYYFKIYPFNGSGTQVNYKTGGGVPQATATTPSGPDFAETILPLTFGTSTSRLPFAFRLSFTGLLPNATYRYINQAVIATDGPTANGAGNPIFVGSNGIFTRSTSPSFSTAGNYGEFSTNANGEASSWFILEPTTNARFTPGNEVFMRIRLNNGSGGTAASHYFTTSGISMLGFGSDPNTLSGTGLSAVSNFDPKNFVFLYGANDRINRPIAGTSIETTGIDFASITTYPAFYRSTVNGVNGAFGTIIPNVNPSGIRTIEERSLATGAVVSVKTSLDGQWGQVQTANPSGGLTEILHLDLDSTPKILVNPNALQGFAYVVEFGPSAEQLFTVSGSKLISQITVTAPASFEISLLGGNQFTPQNTIQIVAEGGIVNSTPLFVRLKNNLTAGTYLENVSLSAQGATTQNVSLSGVVQLPASEPLNHASGFIVSVNSKTQLTATWIDAVPPSTSYLVKGSSQGFDAIADPVDGIAEADGLLVKNVAQGTQSVAFTGLSSETTYYFKLFPYNGIGNQINFKTDGLEPQNSSTTLGEVALMTDLLPLYIQGINGTNNTRLPYAFRATIKNLNPNSTYRYINQAVSSEDSPTESGAGIPIFSNLGNFYRSTNPGFSTTGQYGTFVTDETGKYSGWFMIETTGNARFTPGNNVFMRIRLNNGMEGESAIHYLTSEAVSVINFGQNASAQSGTAIRANSEAGPKNFVFIYDNTDGSGRPVYGTSIETTGIDYATNTSYPAFYREEVAESNGSWGGIVPNLNPLGIRRIEERGLISGNVIQSKTSNDGFWGQANTSNPAGGLNTILVLDLTEGGQLEKIAGQLKFFNEDETLFPSFGASHVFYVQLFENGVPVRPRQLVSFNVAANLSSYFEFNNIEAGRSYTLRVWEQNPNNLLGDTWLWNNWGGVSSIDALIANYRAVESPLVDVFPWIKDPVVNSYTPYFNSVADVNNSGTVTSMDALTILYRTLDFPEIFTFPENTPNFRLAGSKVNNHESKLFPLAPEIVFTMNGAFESESAATSVYFEGQMPQVETGVNVFNVYFVATGDMNASYNPVQGKQTTAMITPTQFIAANVGEEVSIPVFVSQDLSMAAFNLGIHYDNSLLQITSVDGFDLYTIDQGNGIVRIAWMDLKGRTIEKDKLLFTLKAVVLSEISDQTSLSLDVESEFASPDAEVMNEVRLHSPALTNDKLQLQSVALEHSASPNPFSENAAISFTIPEAGHARVSVFNQMGQEVAILVDDFKGKGTHHIELNKNELNGSGVYFYQIFIEGVTVNMSAQGRVLLVK